MLEPAERHLQLGHDVPLGGAALRHGHEELGHRRPRAPDAVILGQGVAERRAHEALVGAAILIGRDLVAGVHLQEPVGAEDLTGHRKRFVDREAVAQAQFLLARGQHDGAAGRDDGAVVVAGIKGAAQRHLDVAEAAVPPARPGRLRRAERHLHFVLAAGPDAMFVDELVLDAPRRPTR